MMLYYFEAEPATGDNDENEYSNREGFSGGGVYRSDATIVENQDILNEAVRDGYNQTGNATSSPAKGLDYDLPTSPMAAERKMLAAPVRGPMANSGNLSPVGIIDLECYSAVHRSALHDCVFELTGDSRTNPDLRSFYFQAADVEDCEMWTKALLSDRHSALKDESEAYKQVCESFQLQLQNMSDMIDEAEGKAQDAERQLYHVRSNSQKYKSSIASTVRETLEQKSWGTSNSNDKILEMSRLNYLDQLDEILASEDSLRSSHKSRTSPVQVLTDYLATVVGSHTELSVQLANIEQKLNQTTTVDNATVSDLKLRLEKLEAEREEEKARYEGKIASIEAQLSESQNACEEFENQLTTQRMEFTMFQGQAKSKLQELSAHKKILKKEVIELRRKKEEVESERDAALHITDSHKMQTESIKEKNEVLEKYIEKMENQVRVQQNMMEMISLSGMSQSGVSHGGESVGMNGSVVGRIIGAPDDSSFSSFGNMRLRDPSPVQNRLPPRSRLPHAPGQPPFHSITKKEFNDPSSPLSLPSTRKLNRKFGEESFDTDDEYQAPRAGIGARGVLDDELNASSSDYPSSNVNIDTERESKPKDSVKPKISNHDESDEFDDNKTNVSELTEDRTQRHFDTTRQIHYTQSDQTGENIIGDGRGFTKTADGKDIPVKYEKITSSRNKNEDGPPRYIIGTDAPESDRDDHELGMSTAYGDAQSTTKSEASTAIFSTTNRTRLSVAQKARIAASQQSNTVDVSSVSETMKLTDSLLKQAENQTAENKAKKKSLRSQSPAQAVFSKIGQRVVTAIDNSVIGVKVPGSPKKSTKTQESEQSSPEPKLSLAQRKKMQRERQLQVLREQGLLKDERKE